MSLRIELSNKIKIVRNNDVYPIELLSYCNDSLIITNPEYYKKQRMGMWLGDTPEFFNLYEKVGEDLYLPFGCFKDLWNILKHRKDVEWVLDEQNKTHKTIKYGSNIDLYPYQKEALKACLKAKNGILVMPCGSGKTQTALSLIDALGKRTLWITHTSDLLKQSMDRAKSCFGLSSDQYGTITAGKVDVGEAITFSTVQTLCKVDLNSLKNVFDVIVVDECHKAVGTPTKMMMFYKCLSGLNARHKYGITATPKRADELEKCMFALLGNIIHRVPASEVQKNVVPVRIEFVQTSYQPNVEVGGVLKYDGTLDYGSLIDDLISNSERNLYIIDKILKTDGISLILTDRVKHAKNLKSYLPESVIVTGKTSKKDREEIFAHIRQGKIKYLISTYALAKEGLDIPNLNNLFMVTPKRDYATVVQSAGRVSRRDGIKKYGTVYDFVDDFGYLKGMAKSRKSHYKKAGYVLTDGH